MALVVGTVIGTGVFLKTAPMAQQLPSPGWVLVVWLLAGILSLSGALTYAELAARLPKSGGEYAYLKAGYGEGAAFLYGWMRFWIASPGTIAAYAAGAATFAFGGSRLAALILIAVFVGINCLRVKTSGGFQTALTALKVILAYVLAAGIFKYVNWSDVDLMALGSLNANVSGGSWTWRGFGIAMIAALWAYDGWNNAPMVAEEIENPSRNLPRALIGGMALIVVTYAIVNFAYFCALDWNTIVSANSTAYPDAPAVGTLAAQRMLGEKAGLWLSIAFAISAVGGMHASILTSARVPFAMARDGLFFRRLAEIHPRTHVPVWSVLTQAIVAVILVMTGTFDQITDYVIFASWVFYGLTSSVVFRLQPDYGAEYFRVPRLVPVMFILVSACLIINSLTSGAREAIIGVILIALGWPVYRWLLKQR